MREHFAKYSPDIDHNKYIICTCYNFEKQKKCKFHKEHPLKDKDNYYKFCFYSYNDKELSDCCYNPTLINEILNK